MITFKSYLIESRSAPLYHATYPENLDAILIKNKGILPRTYQAKSELFTGLNDGRSILGVSTTRSLDFAGQFRTQDYSVVLELDQRALAQNYKIVPFNYWLRVGSRYVEEVGKKVKLSGIRKNEYEEFIITNKPIPTKHIKKIWIHRKFGVPGLKGREILERIRQQYGSSFIGYID